jgi:hypothetical protein
LKKKSIHGLILPQPYGVQGCAGMAGGFERAFSGWGIQGAGATIDRAALQAVKGRKAFHSHSWRQRAAVKALEWEKICALGNRRLHLPGLPL